MINNQEIPRACVVIRLFLLQNLSLLNDKGEKKFVQELLYEENSEISVLFREERWCELQTKESWLKILEITQSIAAISQSKETVLKKLKIILEMFPMETARYIIL